MHHFFDLCHSNVYSSSCISLTTLVFPSFKLCLIWNFLNSGYSYVQFSSCIIFFNCCHAFIHPIPHSFPHPIPQVSLIIPVTFYLISSLPLIVRDCGGLVARADPPEQFSRLIAKMLSVEMDSLIIWFLSALVMMLV